MNRSREDGADAIRYLKEVLGPRGWLRATSGNLSVRLDADTVLITASGTDKQRVAPHDLLMVGMDGRKRDPESGRPSAETGLHLALYQATTAGAVVHVHTVFNNLAGGSDDALVIRDHEMLKALGHWDEKSGLSIPILPNLGDLNALADLVPRRLVPSVPAFLVRRHGVYAWGDTPADALRHLEAVEFLCEWVYYDSLRAPGARGAHRRPPRGTTMSDGARFRRRRTPSRGTGPAGSGSVPPPSVRGDGEL